MGVDETLLNEIVRRVLSVARPDRIILFGSAATGQKYLKALLTFYQVEFPKTHEIERLLVLVSGANREAADALTGAKCISFPGDQPIPTRIEGEIARRLSRRKR